METFVSGIKKIAVILIAGIMLLGVVPVGLLSKTSPTVNAEGDFLRLFPVAEAFVSSKPSERDLRGREISSDLDLVGSGYSSYMRFDISSLLKKDPEYIKSAVLRIATVKTGLEGSGAVRVWLMNDNGWNENVNFCSRPSYAGEKKLALLDMSDKQKTGSVTEVDLTEQVKVALTDRKSEIALHLDSFDSELTAAFAAATYKDSAFRPCLKIVTGEAVDTDQSDLTKAWLDGAATDTRNGLTNSLRLENGSDVYLRFRLNRANILGAMYDIKLKLSTLSVKEPAEVAVSIMNCGEWSSVSEIKDREQSYIGTFAAANSGESLSIDITDAANRIYALGGEFVNLRLSVINDGTAVLFAKGDSAPALDIRATDDPCVIAVTEAINNALGENPSADEISKNLLNFYTSADGTKAYLRWVAFDATSGERISNVNSYGSVTRPYWFENTRTVTAKATITSGGYKAERTFNITLLPDEPPSDSNDF